MSMPNAIAHLLANRHSKTGVVPLDHAPVFLRDDSTDDELALKADLFAAHQDRLYYCPDQDADLFQAVADQFGADTFKDLCLSVAEDLLVLKRTGAGHVLAGGGLFFPSKWALTDKVGKPLMAVHGPVPQYDTALGQTVDRLLARLPEGRPLLRYNWTLHDSDALCQHPDLIGHQRVPPDKMIFRSERQILLRVIGTDAVLFTIKTLQAPLIDAVKTQPDLANYLRDEIARMNEMMRAYKSLDSRAADICEFLSK